MAGSRKMHRGRPHALYVGVRDKLYSAHRIIWTMVNGEIPTGLMIDHVNGNPFDNQLANLRLATNAENLRNRGKNTNNACGLKGVTQMRGGRWMARININGVKTHIGTFDTKDLAHAAYCTAAKIHHGQFARTA